MLIVLLMGALAACSQSSTPPTPLSVATRDPKIVATAVAQLETINHTAVPIYQEAISAMNAGNYSRSRDLFVQVDSMAPNFASDYRRLGSIALNSNDIEGAIEILRKAVNLEPNGYNQSALAWALLQKQTYPEIEASFELATEAARLLPDDEPTIAIWMYAATANNDINTVRQADEQLLRIAPHSASAHYYAGLLAATDGKWEKAEKELLISQQLGMPAEAVQNALKAGISRNARIFRLIRWGVIAIVAWFLGLVILFLTGSILSKATLKALNSSQPDLNTQISSKERKLRSFYRTVITVLSLYFYISIPVVIILLLLVVGGAFYVFGKIGAIPIYFVGILLVMLIGSLIAIIRSVFSKAISPQGHILERMDAPELWKLVEGVAQMLEVPPVDSILLTPDAGIGVYEKGSLLKKMRGSGKRNLLLGMGAFSGLTQGQFATILAHEYGHFSNRDTAGGNLANQVYASFNQMAQRLIRSGAARFYNPVWLFLMGYQRIFLRVTLGASRLQEVLADRYAAMAFGGENFIDGLKNYIRQSIAFPLLANQEIKSAVQLNRTIVNLYDLPMQDDLSLEVGKKFDEVMTRPTSKYDSHPAPKERISLIERLHVPYSPVQDNPRPMLELFPNPETLQREMTSEIRKLIRK
jgi:Zn-dependent protease with chaperone function